MQLQTLGVSASRRSGYPLIRPQALSTWPVSATIPNANAGSPKPFLYFVKVDRVIRLSRSTLRWTTLSSPAAERG
jgi:hypothetical protein